MKIHEFITEEKRFPTGVGKTTVPDPSGGKNGKRKGTEYYSGDPMGIDLGPTQERHFAALAEILKRNGKKFTYCGYAKYPGSPAYNASPNSKPMLTNFVCTAKDFLWQKYEGATAGGGANHVYVAGKKIKLTDFLALAPKKQDALVSMSPKDAQAGIATAKQKEKDRVYRANMRKVGKLNFTKALKKYEPLAHDWDYRQLEKFAKSAEKRPIEQWAPVTIARLVAVIDELEFELGIYSRFG